ncbi:MAG: alpha amylase C-terminal domain-containing protein, partial [Streptosporangiaceae bacterium]
PGVSRPVYLGGLGFGFKWNLGWMHDTLSYLALDPIYRQYHHNEMTFSMVYAYTENFVLPLSHDEVVHGKGSLLGKMPGDEWRRFAGLRSLLAYMWAHPGKQLLFMGSEFGQGSEWSDTKGLDWWVLDFDVHQGVQRLSRDLNLAYRAAPALWQLDASPDGFRWIDANDAQGNVLSFLRFPASAAASVPAAGASAASVSAAGAAAAGAAVAGASAASVSAASVPAGVIACIANFSAVPHLDYKVGLPAAGRWREVINTDAIVYGGSGTGNLGGIEAEPEPWHGLPASASITVPPLGVLWLTPED